MADPFVGQLKLFAGNFAPSGWVLCDGRELDIANNVTLYNLIGTTFGGDGVSTFRVPDLRGRVPIGLGSDTFGNTYQLGAPAGAETVTLTTNQMPTHTHSFMVSSAAGTTSAPGNNFLAGLPTGDLMYKKAHPTGSMAGDVLATAGGSQPHDNLQPLMAINYIMAVDGVYPTQS
jgi:microcystin-dependent protein